MALTCRSAWRGRWSPGRSGTPGWWRCRWEPRGRIRKTGPPRRSRGWWPPARRTARRLNTWCSIRSNLCRRHEGKTTVRLLIQGTEWHRLPASTCIDFQFLPRCPERGLFSPLFTTCCKITQRKLMLFLSHQDYFGKKQDQAGCEAVSKSEMNTRERAFCDIIKGWILLKSTVS